MTVHAVQNILTCVGAASIVGTHTARKHKHKSVCEVAAAPIFLFPVAVLFLQQQKLPLHLGVALHSFPPGTTAGIALPLDVNGRVHTPLWFGGGEEKNRYPCCLFLSVFFSTSLLSSEQQESSLFLLQPPISTFCVSAVDSRGSLSCGNLSKIETVHKD